MVKYAVDAINPTLEPQTIEQSNVDGTCQEAFKLSMWGNGSKLGMKIDIGVRVPRRISIRPAIEAVQMLNTFISQAGCYSILLHAASFICLLPLELNK